VIAQSCFGGKGVSDPCWSPAKEDVFAGATREQDERLMFGRCRHALLGISLRDKEFCKY